MKNNRLEPPTDKEPVKIARVLHYLYEGGTLNRFEAASMLHDTCLNSTISSIRNNLYIAIEGQSEVVKGYKGLETICNRYWLVGIPANVETAYQVLVKHFGYRPVYKTVA